MLSRRGFLKASLSTVCAIPSLSIKDLFASESFGKRPLVTVKSVPYLIESTSTVPYECTFEPERIPQELFFRCAEPVTNLIILRPQDFLELELQFKNFVLARANARLQFIRQSPEAYLIVTLPPQHIAEQSYTTLRSPISPIELPADSQLSSKSRLAFSIPPGVDIIDRKLRDLLSWEALNPSISPSAHSPQLPCGADCDACRVAPKDTETSIELPYRLIISPNQSSVWVHTKDFANKKAATFEIWHTRLYDPSERLELRAVWSADIKKHPIDQLPSACDVPFKTLPSNKDRVQIVNLASNSCLKTTKGENYSPPAIKANSLMLSSLGGFAKLRGSWNPSLVVNSEQKPCFTIDEWVQDTVWSRDEFVLISKKGYVLPFGHYVSFVQTVQREILPGSSLKGLTAVAALRRRYYCQVRESEIDYEKIASDVCLLGRRMPFRKVQIYPDKTPYLKQPSDLTKADCFTDDPCAFWMIPEEGSQPFEFEITAEDWEGRRLSFRLPLLWISRVAAETSGASAVACTDSSCEPLVAPGCDPKCSGGSLKTILDVYREQKHEKYLTGSLAAQTVAFVEPQSALEGNRNLGAFQTDKIVFDVDAIIDQGNGDCDFPSRWKNRDLRFYPAAKHAYVQLTGVSQFSGKDAKTRVAWNKTYSSYGFSDQKNRGKVFLDVENANFQFPASNSGGLTTPSISIRHISAITGPVGGERGDASKFGFDRAESKTFISGTWDAAEFFKGMDALGLGGLSLVEICAPITDLVKEIEKIPKLVEGYLSDLREVEDLRALKNRIESILEAVQSRHKDIAVLRDLARQRLQGVELNVRQGIANAERELKQEIETARERYVLLLREALDDIGESYIRELRDLCDPNTILKISQAWMEGLLDTIHNLGTFPLADIESLVNLIGATISDLSDPSKLLGALHADLDRLRKELKVPSPAEIKDRQKAVLAMARESACSVLTDTRICNLGSLAPLTTNAAEQLEKYLQSIRKHLDQTIQNISQQEREQINELFEKTKASIERKVNDLQSLLAKEANQAFIALEMEILGKIDPLLAELYEAFTFAAKELAPIIGKGNDLLAKLPQEYVLRYEWKPRLRDASGFLAQNKGVPAKLTIVSELRKALALNEISKPPVYNLNGSLTNFQIVLLPSARFITIRFNSLSFVSANGSKPDVTTKIDDVEFGDQLEFVKTLASILNGESGFFLNVSASGVQAGYKFAVPTLMSGGFNLTQLSISISFILPFDGGPVRVGFGISERFRPFLCSVPPFFGGGGFFLIQIGPKGLVSLEASIEFGAVFFLDLRVARGMAKLTGGIYFSKSIDTAFLSGFVSISGSLTVLFVVMCLDFYLGLGYEKRGMRSYAVGEARLTIGIKIGFFKVSVGITCRREFEGGSAQEVQYVHSIASDIERSKNGRTLVAPGMCKPIAQAKSEWRSYKRQFLSWS